MSTFKIPVGPQSPKVYWRRRLVVGLGVLAVIIVVLLIIFRPGANAPAKNDAKTPGETTTSEPTDEPAAQQEGEACNPANITVEAITDQNQYAAGVTPKISLSVTNVGAVACVMNVGTTQQLFEITSGSETYWKSTDCQQEPVDLERVLEPSVAQTTTAIEWDRTRSDPSTCEADRAAVPAGGASYHLSVSVGDIEGESSKQFLLY